MGWLANLFSEGTAKLVDSVGDAIDKCSTTDEEKLKLRNELERTINSFKEAQLQAMAQQELELSKRHAADMMSDSWLSKNIRPLALAFLTIATILLAYLTIFILDQSKVELIESWQGLLTVLLGTTYAFYFGSRGFEKVQSIRKS